MDIASRNHDDSEGSEEEVFGLDDGEDEEEEEESEDDLGDLDDDFGGAKEDSEEDIDSTFCSHIITPGFTLTLT